LRCLKQATMISASREDETMKTKNKWVAGTVLALVVAGIPASLLLTSRTASAVPGSETTDHVAVLTPSQQCPHIASAITALNDAKIDLNNAQNTFNTHKTQALNAIGTAQSQLQDCLALCVPAKTAP
jgi:hypothetical protein